MPSIGIVSPGAMGSTLAKPLIDSGHDVFWASEFRSTKTKENADLIGINDVFDVSKLFGECDYIFCILSGSGWMDVAKAAIANKYDGIYVDFNGLYPNDIDALSNLFLDSKVKYVEGAVRAWPLSECKEIPSKDNPAYLGFEPRTMYLSGEELGSVVSLHKVDFWKFVECDKSAKFKVLEISNTR